MTPSGRGSNLLDRTYLSYNGRDQPVITLAMDYRGTPPTLDLLVGRVKERAAHIPRLHTGTAALGSNVFGTDVSDIDKETGRVSRSPFDLVGGLPLWDVRLLAGDPGSAFFRVCFRVHHGFLDGVGATHAATALLPDEPGEGARPHPPESPGVRGMARVLKDMASSLVHRSAWSPPHSTAPHHTDGRSVYRDVPVAVLRAYADTYGVSVNDVSLAALGLAFGDWQRDRVPAESRRDIVASVAVSTRTPEERHHAGNRLGVYRLTFPHRIESFAEAVSLVCRQTARVRDTRQRDALRKALGVPVPPKLGVRAFSSMLNPQATPFVISSVSLPENHTLFGAELRAASMTLNVFENFPAYISFTRTPENVRCAAVSDPSRNSVLAVPDHWANCLA
ncbi:hypothetical protein OG413_38100 [Streptomyces sp. NBC_01433]|uniref:wax ester/triacylglycerol synthase domain-containing protein n=1 Tax=Streptomyces sp. NBC_01433 TaxID=2903864 RepID=UPI00224CEDA2|nr:wax ester/triacylglycerol synthase domain-containing protein [Streptomyces sp. NBC_01433]MCX4681026.1 hypothetical protein [Streptomyces sp. NBC_01433]